MRIAQKKSFNRQAIKGFTLIELLVVILIVGMLMGVFVPVLSDKMKQARHLEVANKMRTICQSYHAHLLETGETIPSSSVKAFAQALANKTGLGANDGSLWFIEGDPKVEKDKRPKSTLSDWGEQTSSFVIAKNVHAGSPGYTPLVWTRGLEDGSAFSDSSNTPLRIKGGFIGFLDGKVVECKENTDLHLFDGKNFTNDVKTVLSQLLN